jgi:hypothetical protein
MRFRSLREFADVSPSWVQPDVLDRRYELRADDAVIATLGWETTLGSLATGETAEGRWTLKRAGFLRPRVMARVAGSKIPAATVTLHWDGNGDVNFADGHEFRWARMSFWHSEWAFTSKDGQPLLVFKPKFVMLGAGAEIEIEAHALSLPELSLLALLGWYLIVLIHEETVAAGIP